MTHLVKLEGNKMSRFEGNKLLETREFDMSGTSGAERKQHVEYVREHGFKGYDPTRSEIVFDRIVRELAP